MIGICDWQPAAGVIRAGQCAEPLIFENDIHKGLAVGVAFGCYGAHKFVKRIVLTIKGSGNIAMDFVNQCIEFGIGIKFDPDR